MGSFPNVSSSFPANDDFSSQFRNKKTDINKYPTFPDFGRDSIAHYPATARQPRAQFATPAPTLSSAQAAANQVFQGSTSIGSNILSGSNESKEDISLVPEAAVPDGTNRANADLSDFMVLQRIGANLRQLAIDVSPMLFTKVSQASTSRERFRVAWWFMIFQSAHRASMVEQLVRLGFTPPPWVAIEHAAQRPPYPAQWGNMAITLPAISNLYKCYIHFYRGDTHFMALFTIDELLFFRTFSQAQAQLFDKRAIAEAILLSIDQWTGAPNLYSLFKNNLVRPEFDKVNFNHYRVDKIPSSNYSNLKGCVGPAVFEKLAKDDFMGLAKRMAKRSRQRSFSGNNSRFSANKSVAPNISVSTIFPEIDAKAPSGVPYPDTSSLIVPTTQTKNALHAPRLEHFAKAFSFVPTPAFATRSYYDYVTVLGKCPLYYCASYQSNNCRRRSCDYHHLCEWCAQPHHGNSCPYRPKDIALRK